MLTHINFQSKQLLEQAANIATLPLRTFSGTSYQVEILKTDKGSVYHMKESSPLSWTATLVALIFFIPSLVLGIPLKFVANLLYHNKEELTKITRAIRSNNAFISVDEEALIEAKEAHQALKIAMNTDENILFSEVTFLSLLDKASPIKEDLCPRNLNRILLEHSHWLSSLKEINTKTYFTSDLDPSEDLTSDFELKKSNFIKLHRKKITQLLDINPKISLTYQDGNQSTQSAHKTFSSYFPSLNIVSSL